jgi:hypothetical protein
MILWLGLGAGLLAGIDCKVARTFLPLTSYYVWLVLLVSPHFLLSILGIIGSARTGWQLSIVTSQFLLLVFAWLNRQLLGMWILITGLILI